MSTASTVPIKRRVEKSKSKSKGRAHRIYVTLSEPTLAHLNREGLKLGYSVSWLAAGLIDRAIAYKMPGGEKPNSEVSVVDFALVQEYTQIVKKNEREDAKRIKLLTEFADLSEQRIAQLEKRIESHKETILRQAVELAIYETGSATENEKPV